MTISNEDLLLELFIKGIFVEGESNIYLDLKKQNLQRYKRFDFYFNQYRYSTYMEEMGKTPYRFIRGNLYYYDELLQNVEIKRIEEIDWGSEKSWYIKKWNNLDNEPYELRLNPINICSNLRYITGENGEYRRKCLMGEQKGYDIHKVIDTLTLARQYFKFSRITYVVGLDSYDSLEAGFTKLKNLGLIDDVVPLIFVPYTPEMKNLRTEDATEIDYYKKVRKFFQNNNLVPLKNGLTKNLFQEDKLNNNGMDELLEMRK